MPSVCWHTRSYSEAAIQLNCDVLETNLEHKALLSLIWLVSMLGVALRSTYEYEPMMAIVWMRYIGLEIAWVETFNYEEAKTHTPAANLFWSMVWMSMGN